MFAEPRPHPDGETWLPPPCPVPTQGLQRWGPHPLVLHMKRGTGALPNGLPIFRRPHSLFM